MQRFPTTEINHYSGRDCSEKIIASIVSKVKLVSETQYPNDHVSDSFREPIQKHKPDLIVVSQTQEIVAGGKMSNWYSELKKLNGRKCFTLTQDRPAIMYVDDDGVTIEYPTRGRTRIPRSMLEEANHKLRVKGMLTLEDVHEGITKRNGPITDRLMAVFRELPGIGFTKVPRTLFLKK